MSCAEPKGDNASKSQADSFETVATHFIDVKCDGEFLPLRNRVLSNKELLFSNNGSDSANRLNREDIIQRLYNGQNVKLLKKDTLGYHLVQVVKKYTTRDTLIGFIISEYCNEPTLKKLEKVKMTEFEESQRSENFREFLGFYSPESDLLDYSFMYVTHEADFIQALTFDITSYNEIYYQIYAVSLQSNFVFFNGSAHLYESYKDENEIKFSRFLADNIMGREFEIHISEDGRLSFLHIIDTFDIDCLVSPLDVSQEIFPGEKIIMERIN
jgi:hypothetical protein